MRRLDAIEALRAQTDRVRAMGATALYLFGSTARDAAEPSSDVDLFLDYHADRRFSLIELVSIQRLLEDRLGVRIDLTTRDGLDPMLKSGIEASAERIF
jgi:predicted nucleotidyltransferase